jgi:hypothetical protein
LGWNVCYDVLSWIFYWEFGCAEVYGYFGKEEGICCEYVFVVGYFGWYAYDTEAFVVGIKSYVLFNSDEWIEQCGKSQLWIYLFHGSVP